MSVNAPDSLWKFYRLGGFDQVVLRTEEELARLDDLDPKLWIALSCPISGLEFDARTLALIDADGDGRIRVPEVKAAVQWLKPRLASLQTIVDAPEKLPLDRINMETKEGARLAATAAMILESLGKPEALEISYEDVLEALKYMSEALFNGDGVIHADPQLGEDVAAFVQDALAIMGGIKDAGGRPGINAEIAQAFMESLAAWKNWRETMDNAATPLGGATDEAWLLLQGLSSKIDDYFLRCDMMSFAPWTLGEHETNSACGAGAVEARVLEDMPLARVEANRPLSLSQGINPAWRERVERFAELAAPLLGGEDALTRDDWKALRKTFQGYEDAFAQKPPLAAVAVSLPPEKMLDALGEERVSALLAGGVFDRVMGRIREDADAPAASVDIADLERLVLYHAHLYRLLMNFVSFYDFYSLRRNAIFQTGTLFLDGRSCTLCLPADDPAKHATLASLSQLCLIYCQCSRLGDQPEAGKETMGIVAAVTAGDADMLVEGRNGVFVDANGNDWDAVATKIVSNPISLREAIWDPYRRFGRMIAEQINKFAAAKDAAVTQKLEAAATAPDIAKPSAQPFDIGKSVGIFAAIGLALGALGTAVGSLVQALASLAWWQFPLVVVGAFIIISGPSFVLAWLRLRKRALGPLLEASGWAVNSLAPINFALGKKLTGIAELPPNAERNVNDPLRKRSRWPYILMAALSVAVAAGVWAWFRRPNIPFPWL